MCTDTHGVFRGFKVTVSPFADLVHKSPPKALIYGISVPSFCAFVLTVLDYVMCEHMQVGMNELVL